MFRQQRTWKSFNTSRELLVYRMSENLETRLKALQCHFTWDLDPSRSRLLCLRASLEDIGAEEGNSWLGHIYNLQGFVQTQLGSTTEALRFFSRASEAFQRAKSSDEGPWLVVNYGNLSWLHHQLREDQKSLDYLSKVDALMEKHPPPIEGELHPEVGAEKAWTLMRFGKDNKLLAADYFQKAFRMQPEMVQWQTSRLVALLSALKHDSSDLDADLLEDLRVAKQEDPENLYLAAADLKQRAERGEQIRDEAQELAEKILQNPVSSYSGLKPLLRAYRQINAYDEAIKVSERALEQHPESRYLKRCAALCYKWRIIYSRESRPNQTIIDRAISLYKEVIALYPQSSLVKKTDLANIEAKSGQGLARADQMYQELLAQDLEPADQQLLYNNYAKYLNFERKDRNKSVKYHMKAAAINHQSFFRQNSINSLRKIQERGRNRMCSEIQIFLENLGDVESA